jgi:hypothetical protein
VRAEPGHEEGTSIDISTLAARVIGDMMAPQSAPSADGSGDTRPFVEQSDAKNAPTFEPPGDGKVDDVM